MKQVIVVRKDLALSAGKMSAQVAHASISAYKKADKNDCEMWELVGQKKVVLKVLNEKELLKIFMRAKKEKIPCALIKDAGRTEIAPGTSTCVGIGPTDDSQIDLVVGDLKLY
ncbi:MAG: peptidyl-tRNA hydrolase Pth2 [Candidatus Aenigmarchaeota archaeon]|nr:peptidyl-tRNA hydrolase Pth2 [Candidatus Aenigmarchaeota archaeon]